MKGCPFSMQWEIQSLFCGGHRKGHCLILNIVAFICCVDLIIKGLAVNGQVLRSVEARSSRSHIIATKGSSVWLHWNYTYIGDGIHFGGALTTLFREQRFELNSTSETAIKTLARRTGQIGVLTLESPIPAPFNGRVEVISSNSTIVIHNLQYNDSTYHFSSYVTVDLDVGAGASANRYNLRPVVSIKVNGAPEFISQPPYDIVVTENSNSSFTFEFNGNPNPATKFRWLHLPSSSSETVHSIQLYPYVYSSTCLLTNVNATYCGRVLQTVLKNSMGYSKVKVTHVTVLLTLDNDFDLEAGYNLESNCVEVKWNKAESGACYVKYEVKFKNVSGNYIFYEIGYNIGQMKKCSFPNNTNITEVRLKVSFRSASKTVTAKVSTKVPTTASASTASITTYSSKSTKPIDMNGSSNVSSDDWKSRDSAFVAVIVILILVNIIMLMILIIKLRRKPNQETQEKNLRQAGQAEMHYMDLEIRSKEAESNYAKLQGEYEEVGRKNPQYVNM